jgi:hypothetical protein
VFTHRKAHETGAGPCGAIADERAVVHPVDMSRRPNITIQVFENGGGHVGLQGAFTVAEIMGSACSVNMEDIADGRVCDDAPP